MKKVFNKKSLIIIILIIILYPIITLIVCGSVYNLIFNNRYETRVPLNFKIDDFDNLNRKQFKYKSNNDDDLIGYLYFNNSKELHNYNGVVIVVHGLGSGGHSTYMEVVNYFVNQNLFVFSYDASGNDESGGVINGLPQQLIDLHTTINYVRNNINEIKNLPLFLFGHSWGGYAVTNVLNFTNEISAVVSAAGFNSSYDIIKYYSLKYASIIAYTGLPFVKAHERIKFGEYGNCSALEAFEKTNANILVIHSEDDEVVPIEIGYNLFYDKFKNDNRFKFVKYTNKGHSYVLYSKEATEKIDSFNNKFNDWLLTLEYDYNKKKNTNRFNEDKIEFYNKNLDRSVMCNLIDKHLFVEIMNFYNQSIN